MSERRGPTSLLTDQNIGTKVSLGFACVLIILAVVSATAWFAFAASAEGFARYRHYVTVVDVARDIDRSFVNLRRYVREFAFTSVESNVVAARHEAEGLHTLLQKGLATADDSDQRQKLRAITDLIRTYLENFERLVTQTRETDRIRLEVLTPLGNAQVRNFDVLVIEASKAGDESVTPIATAGQKTLLQARLDISRLLSQHDVTAAGPAEEKFAELESLLHKLEQVTQAAVYHAIAANLLTGVVSYHEAARKAGQIQAEVNTLVNVTMLDLGAQVQQAAEAIKASGVSDEQQQEQATLATIEYAATTILTLSVGGVLVGLVLAWLIGRGIARPVVRMCAAMRALAGGDVGTDIPGLTRGDEIGAMAKTVDVFKNNALEMERLRVEQEEQKRQAQIERREALSRLADGFEIQVGAVIQVVGAATSHLQAASQHMQENAANTAAEATSVATASEQSAANAQAVASASEQLTASINEIAKQVNGARVIASRADAEANQTTGLVDKLSQDVNAIGAIVALINDVASQTNLLALNATIEAARAGDAGKGFAVVASEVKNLANQTAKATEEIASKIGAVQSGTAAAAQAIASTTQVMQQMSGISGAIAAAVEQQSAATAEIARNVEQSAAGTQEVSMRIAKVEVAARDTGTTANEINGSATELVSQTQMLQVEVARFLGQVRADKDQVRLLSWDNAWAVGVPSIDRHHRAFLEGINDLFSHLFAGDGRDAVPRIAQLVGESIEPHFTEEEALMRRYNYADFAVHQRSHKVFLDRFRAIAQELQTGKSIDPGKFFDFISMWFKNHMTEHDVPMARFLRTRQAA